MSRRKGQLGSGLILTLCHNKGKRQPPSVPQRTAPYTNTHCCPSPPTHLLVWVHVDVALDALLSHVGPGVPTHPFSLALGTLVFAEAALFALVRGQTLAFGACLEGRKQTQRTGIHQAKRMPHRVPTVSLFSLQTPRPRAQAPFVPNPENTQEPQGWETCTGDREQVVHIIFRFKGSKYWMVARNHFLN